MILAIRTDDRECSLVLLDKRVVDQYKWHAGNQLSQELLPAIKKVLQDHGLFFEDISGIIFYEGPGSYTGLRIGASVVNALGYSYGTPVVASSGVDWVQSGLQALKNTHDFKPTTPAYGGNARVTNPKK